MMEKFTVQQRDTVKAAFIFGILMFGGVFAFYYFYVKPEITRQQFIITERNAEIKELEQTIKEMDEAVKDIEALREKQRLLEQVAAKLPSNIAPEEFYKALDEILQATRVEYSEMSQQVPQERSVYTEIPYRISGKGRYHDFGQFLNMVEENPNRLMRIKKFSIENDDNRPSVHPLQVELATFKFNNTRIQ